MSTLESQPASDEVTDREQIAAERTLLREENDRLRRAVADAHRTRHTRAAVSLAALGLIALLGALAFPAERSVLIALGGTGLFTATVTRFLTTERFVSADIGEKVYEALVSTHESTIAELGLQNVWIYVPSSGERGVRLFVPQHTEYVVPSDTDVNSTFVVTDDSRHRGMTFEPTGRRLLTELETTITGEPSTDPTILAEQITDGIVEDFELARGATPEVDPAAGRATIAIVDSAYGSVDQFDHPIASLFAVTFATILDEPVTLETYDAEGSSEQFIKCSWDGSALD